MTNKEFYRLIHELVNKINKFFGERGLTLVDIELSLKKFREFCGPHKSCKECPFFEREEDCFIQWLNTEVGK